MSNVLIFKNNAEEFVNLGITKYYKTESLFLSDTSTYYYLAYNMDSKKVNEKYDINCNQYDQDIVDCIRDNSLYMTEHYVSNNDLLKLVDYIKKYNITMAYCGENIKISEYIVIKFLGLKIINEDVISNKFFNIIKNIDAFPYHYNIIYLISTLNDSIDFLLKDNNIYYYKNLIDILKSLDKNNLLTYLLDTKNHNYKGYYISPIRRFVYNISYYDLIDEETSNLVINLFTVLRDFNNVDPGKQLMYISAITNNKEINTKFMNFNINYFLSLKSKPFLEIELFLRHAKLFEIYIEKLTKENKIITESDLDLFNFDKLENLDELSNVILKSIKRNSAKDLDIILFSVLFIFKDKFNWNEISKSTLIKVFPMGVNLKNFKISKEIKSSYDYYINAWENSTETLTYREELIYLEKMFLFILISSEEEFEKNLNKLCVNFIEFISSRLTKNGNHNKSSYNMDSFIHTTLRKCLYIKDTNDFINKKRTYKFFSSIAKIIDDMNNKNIIYKYLSFLENNSLNDTIGDIKQYSKTFKSIKLQKTLNK